MYLSFMHENLKQRPSKKEKLETATFYTYATTEKLKIVGSPVSHWKIRNMPS